MRDLLAQIRVGINAGLYYLVLFPLLAIPDICGALESKDGQATKERYVDWFHRYVAAEYVVAGRPSLTGEDCYYFRCSLFHQGAAQHPKSSYSRILFVEPGVQWMVLHNNILNDALNIDVRIFCNDMVGGAEEWLIRAENTAAFRANYPKFMRRYAQGLPPYIVGVPLIA